MPRRSSVEKEVGSAPGMAFGPFRAEPVPGAEPRRFSVVRGGAEPRLTSDGEAVNSMKVMKGHRAFRFHYQ